MSPIIPHIAADSKSARAQALDILRNQGCVALPTETVYGLAADGGSDEAVARIYALKNRPSLNPLIIHGWSRTFLESYVAFHDLARAVADHFWPGPLSLVLPKKDPTTFLLPSAGLNTLAVRVPRHQVTLDIIQELNRPLAAPSANPSNFLSPTTAQDVALGFQKHHIDATSAQQDLMILDGGPCVVGLESTIIDATNPHALSILRPGFITEDDLYKAGFPVINAPKAHQVTAPGQLPRHYAPLCPLLLDVPQPAPEQAWLCFGPQTFQHSNVSLNLSPAGHLTEAAAHLFHFLHKLDQQYLHTPMPFTSIAVQSLPRVGLGVAIHDRLHRATTLS